MKFFCCPTMLRLLFYIKYLNATSIYEQFRKGVGGKFFVTLHSLYKLRNFDYFLTYVVFWNDMMLVAARYEPVYFGKKQFNELFYFKIHLSPSKWSISWKWTRDLCNQIQLSRHLQPKFKFEIHMNSNPGNPKNIFAEFVLSKPINT